MSEVKKIAPSLAFVVDLPRKKRNLFLSFYIGISLKPLPPSLIISFKLYYFTRTRIRILGLLLSRLDLFFKYRYGILLKFPAFKNVSFYKMSHRIRNPGALEVSFSLKGKITNEFVISSLFNFLFCLRFSCTTHNFIKLLSCWQYFIRLL